MLVVFDLDGTLSDSQRAIVDCFREACRLNGAREPLAADVVARIGLPLDRMFRELCDGDSGALCRTYRDRYAHHDGLHTRLFDGVEGLLAGLAGHALAVATSKSTDGAERSVARSGIRPHFVEVLGHDAVERPKPHPDMLLELMRRTGFAARDTVMVGDTVYDLEMADAAGVRGVGVAWGAHGAARLGRWPVAHSLEQLASLI